MNTVNLKSSIDFTHILMSSVHDMKNSLIFFQNTLDVLALEQSKLDDQGRSALSKMHYETQRINNTLIQILSLYKLDQNMVHLNTSSVMVYEFLNEQIQQNSSTTESSGIGISLVCQRSLEWIFDAGLLSGAVGTVINNALRYCESKIRLSADIKEGELIISIEDDGAGFPDSILNATTERHTDIDYDSGSTGLGIFFAGQIANMHVYEGKQGHIELKNNSDSGGGCFKIFIPGHCTEDFAALLSGD